MDDRTLKNLLALTKSPAVKWLEDVDRMHSLRGQLTELSSVNPLHQQIASLNSSTIDQITDHLNARQSLFDSINQLGGIDSALASVAEISKTRSLSLSVTEDLRRAQELLGPSITNVLAQRSELLAAMNGIRTPSETIASLASATRSLDSIRTSDSFATVGAASFAAADLFASGEILRDKFSSRIDLFFGDWSRIDSFPMAYPNDYGARREVITEIQADEDLLEIETEEAAAIIEESLIDEHGEPVMVLGQPTGLVLTKNPGEATFSLLSHFERKVRSKVVIVMRAKFGENWIEDKCADFLPIWRQKREDEIKARLQPGHLIEYSTLFELEKIITRFWTDAFAFDDNKPRIISRPLNALIPFRNRTFHAREVNAEILFGVVHNVRKVEAWLVDLSNDEDL